MSATVHIETLRLMLEGVEVECGEEIGAAERSAGVAGVNGMYLPEDIAPYLRCDALEFVDGSHGAKLHRRDGAIKQMRSGVIRSC